MAWDACGVFVETRGDALGVICARARLGVLILEYVFDDREASRCFVCCLFNCTFFSLVKLSRLCSLSIPFILSTILQLVQHHLLVSSPR